MSGFEGFGGGSLSSNHWSANTNQNFSSGLSNSNGFSQAASSNSTFAVINEFKSLAARSVRTSTIILAAFNTVTAFATAAGIYYDCYSSAKRNRPRGKGKVSKLKCIREEEIFPLILNLGITVQGIIFAVSQAQGLNGIFAKGCSLVSQFMWPAIFIVPYIQLIFGVEATLRGLRSKPFPPRGKWNVAICLAVLKIMLLGTGLIAFFIRASDFCFASLFWFVAKWAEGGFILLTMIAVILTGCAIILFVKLTRHSTIESTERVAISRLIYYLAVAIISDVLIVPFFVYLTFDSLRDSDGNTGSTLSMIATVVANVSGLVNGGLHLFLRSKTISTIAPREDKLPEYEREQLKHKISRVNTVDNDYDSSCPIRRTIKGRSIRRTESEESLVRYKEGGRVECYTPTVPTHFVDEDVNPLKSNAVYPSSPIPRFPAPAQLPPAQSSRAPGGNPPPSYSPYANGNTVNTGLSTLLPSTTYSPDPEKNFCADCECEEEETLKPPSKPFMRRHKRDSSMASSATVQIGLRLSNVEHMHQHMPPMASARIQMAEAGRIHHLDSPRTAGPSPITTRQPVNFESPSPVDYEPSSPVNYEPSPISPIPSSPVFPRVPSPSRSPDLSKSDKMKTLPPVPHSVTQPAVAEDPSEEIITLSPAVYRPNSPTKPKIPSPKGVGFNVPKRSNTTPVQNTNIAPPPRTRGNSDAADSRDEWI